MKNLIYVIVYPLLALLRRDLDLVIFKYSKGRWFARRPKGIWVEVKTPRIYCFTEYFRYFLVERDEVVIDVGGELGKETLEFSEMVGEKGKVYVFECFPPHIEHLTKITSCLPQVEIVPRACWNEAKTITLFKGITPGSNTVVSNVTGQKRQPLANLDAERFDVQAGTLDDFWKENINQVQIGFLKMDIEGAEIEALLGASEMLKLTQRAVIASYHHRDDQVTAERVCEILKTAGFPNLVRDANNHVYAWR